MESWSDVEVISVDDDERDTGGEGGSGRYDEDAYAVDGASTAGEEPPDDEEARIGERRGRGRQEQSQPEEREREHDDSAGMDVEEDVFSQEMEEDDEQENIGEARRHHLQQEHSRRGGGDLYYEEDEIVGKDLGESDDEDASIGSWHSRQQRQDQHRQGAHSPRPPSPRVSGSWRDPSALVDLTAVGSGSGGALGSPTPVVSFQEEYDELVEGSSEGGGGFPFEAVAELLLRQPEHWWCR